MRKSPLFALFLITLFGGASLKAQSLPVPVGAATTQKTTPYLFAGRISATFGVDEYIGSGTVIRPARVITCGHILYDEFEGWATGVYFERGLYNNTRLSLKYATAKLLLSGYSAAVTKEGADSSRAFSRDLGGLKFNASTFGFNGYAGRWANPALLTSGLYNITSLGYGGEVHNGSELLRCSSKRRFFSELGPYYYTDGFAIEGGMSGGPVLANYGGKWYTLGVNVSGDGSSSGIRAFDKEAETFIASSLK